MNCRLATILIFLVLFALCTPAIAVPGLPHTVTFVNSANQPVWVNLQGGPKGVCTGVIDNGTHNETACSACSLCAANTNTSGQQWFCNTTLATGNTTPLCCPGTTPDIPRCYTGGGCDLNQCCPGVAASSYDTYNCPGIHQYTFSNSTGFHCGMDSSGNQSLIDSLTGYNNASTGLHLHPCNGTLIENGGFKLNVSEQKTYSFEYGWQGGFFPRTNCSYNSSGVFSCETGPCKDLLGHQLLQCGGAGSVGPVSKGEFNFDDGGDFYDVSLVDGFNVGIVIQPNNYNQSFHQLDPVHKCGAAGCSVGLPAFTQSMHVPNITLLQFQPNNNIVGIDSDCSLYARKFNTSGYTDVDKFNGYCCPVSAGYVNDLSHCNDTPKGVTCKVCAGQHLDMFPFNVSGALPNSAQLFLDVCPGAYAYTYNDTDPLRSCIADTGQSVGYTITFSNPGLAPLQSSSGGSSSAPSSASASSGSSVASAPGGDAGEEISLSFGQVASSSSPVAVSSVSLAPSGKVEQFTLLAHAVTLGAPMQIQDRPVAGYMEITPIGVNPSSVDFHIIHFSVAGSWITDNGINPSSVVLARYHDNQWTDLPTQPAGASSNGYLFDADTPGFSYFAVTVNATANATLTQTLTQTVPSPGIAGQTGTAAPENIVQAPASLTASTTAPPALSQTQQPIVPQSSPISAITVGIGIIAVLVIAGLALIIRRWWIRRQNPLLFKKF